MRAGAATAFALLGAFLILGSARAEDGPVPVMPDAVKWRDYPFASGVQVSMLYGSAEKEGIYTARVKMENGARLKIHTHPNMRMVTVISGKLYAGRGTKYDSANETIVPAGGFFVVPANTPHYTRAGDGEVIYQENGDGPSPVNYLPE
jgi:quercetin dioxygenase-like cupin family protein